MTKKRDVGIDIFKGILVIGMVICHCIQFFSDINVFYHSRIFMHYFNFITFSGFVFAFGYTSYLAYFSHPREKVRLRMIKTAGKTLIAFYISGIAFRVLVEHRSLDVTTILPILGLIDIPGWSEFIISFSLYILVVAILYHPISYILDHKKGLLMACGILLLTCLIPYEKIKVPQIGLLIGTKEFASFPILQYMPFYLIGMYFSKEKIGFDKRVLIISIIFTSCTTVYIALKGNIPGRFPPSFFWIIAPCFVLYIYYLLSQVLAPRCYSNFLVTIGENTLFYFLMTNLFIFALKGAGTVKMMGLLSSALIAMMLILLCYYIYNIIRKIPLDTLTTKDATMNK